MKILVVGESVQKPAMYYASNVTNTMHLLDAMRAAGVQCFIFSSTAATFNQYSKSSLANHILTKVQNF